MEVLSEYQPNVTDNILIESFVFEKQMKLIKLFRSIFLNELIKMCISRVFQKQDTI